MKKSIVRQNERAVSEGSFSHRSPCPDKICSESPKGKRTDKEQVHFGDIVGMVGRSDTGGQEVSLSSGLDVERDLVGDIADSAERHKDPGCSSLWCSCAGFLLNSKHGVRGRIGGVNGLRPVVRVVFFPCSKRGRTKRGRQVEQGGQRWTMEDALAMAMKSACVFFSFFLGRRSGKQTKPRM